MRLQRQKRREQRKISQGDRERVAKERHAQWLHLSSLSAPAVGATSPLGHRNALDEVMLEEPMEEDVQELSQRSNSSAYSKLNSIPEGSSGNGRSSSLPSRSRQGSLASVSAGSRKGSLLGWLAGSRATSASSENLLESSEIERLSCIASCREGEEEEGPPGAAPQRMSFVMADMEVDPPDVAANDASADLVALSVSASAWARVSAGSSGRE